MKQLALSHIKLFCLISFFSPLLLAQGDLCNEAIEISIDEYPYTLESLTGSFADLSLSPELRHCLSGISNRVDLWLTFEATEEVLILSGAFSYFTELYSGDCSDLQFIKCLDTQAPLTDLVVGNRYYLRLYGALHFEYQVNLKNMAPGPFDTSCEDPFELTEAILYDQDLIGTADSIPEASLACVSGQYSDVWFSLTAQCSSYDFSFNSFSQISSLDSQLEIYENNCNDLEAVFCDDLFSYFLGGKIFYEFEVGRRYLLRLSSKIDASLVSTPITFKISPNYNYTNTRCENPSLKTAFECATICDSISSNNVCYAEPDTIDLPACWDNEDQVSLWYRFSARHSSYAFRSDATMEIALYKTDCENLELLACGTPINYNDFEVGENYLIRAAGEGLFCLQPPEEDCLPETPINDECTNALEIFPSQNPEYTNVELEGATFSNDDCITNDTSDVWFKFIATAEELVFETSNNDLLSVSLYEANCISLRLIDCYRNIDNFKISELEINKEYLIKVSSNVKELSFFKLHAVPTNNTVDKAMDLPVDSCFAASTKFLNNEELWFAFEPQQRSYEFSIDVIFMSSVPDNSNLSIYQAGSNNVPMEIATFNGQDLLHRISFEEGTKYFLSLRNLEEINFCVKPLESATNDEWLNPKNIELGAFQYDLGFGECLSNFIELDQMTVELWESDGLSCVPNQFKPDLWYSFSAPSSAILLNLINRGQYQIYDFDPNQVSLNCPLTENEASREIIRDLEEGKTYLLRFFFEPFSIRHVPGDNFCLEELPQNSNDDFINAKDLPILPPFSGCANPDSSYYLGVNDPTTESLIIDSCQELSLEDDDVWFKFTATSSLVGVFHDFIRLNYELYTLETNGLSCFDYGTISTQDDDFRIASVIDNLEIGEEYYLRLHEEFKPNNYWEIAICLYELPPPPINDNIEDALELFASDNLYQCRTTGTLPLNDWNDYSVWFKFKAQKESHQLAVNSTNSFINSKLYEINSNNELSLISEHTVLGTFQSSILGSDAKYGRIDLQDNPFLSLHNYLSLTIDKEYYIEIFHSPLNILQAPFVDIVPFTYSACLKTLPDMPTNIGYKKAEELISSDPVQTTKAYATRALPDYFDYPQSDTCQIPDPLFQYFRPEVWFHFTAEAENSWLHLKNNSRYPTNASAMEAASDDNYFLWNLETFVSFYEQDDQGAVIPWKCEIPVDSLYELTDLKIGQKYYVKVYFQCLNYLTDLEFEIGLCSLVDQDGDGFYSDKDCNDNDPLINPEAEEIPNNGIDEDCDGYDLISAADELSQTDVRIYPNPVNTVIHLELDRALDIHCTLYNLNGQNMKIESNAERLEIGTIQPGTYLLEIKDIRTGQRVIKKICVLR